MANSLSAKKRILQNERRRLRNRARRSAIKTETRRLLDAIKTGDATVARDLFGNVQKKLDQVAAKGTLHPNTVARRKSRLAKRLNALASSKTA